MHVQRAIHGLGSMSWPFPSLLIMFLLNDSLVFLSLCNCMVYGDRVAVTSLVHTSDPHLAQGVQQSYARRWLVVRDDSGDNEPIEIDSTHKAPLRPQVHRASPVDQHDSPRLSPAPHEDMDDIAGALSGITLRAPPPSPVAPCSPSAVAPQDDRPPSCAFTITHDNTTALSPTLPLAQHGPLLWAQSAAAAAADDEPAVFAVDAPDDPPPTGMDAL